MTSAILKFLLFGLVFSKKFLIETETFSSNSLNIFEVQEQENILDKITLGDLTVYVVEYQEFPFNLYSTYGNVIKNIEEDQDVFINSPFQKNLMNSVNQKSTAGSNTEQSYYLQSDPIWNLDRIDQRSNVLDDRYFYETSGGENVDVFIVDTGIQVDHFGFSQKVSWGFNGADDVDNDCNGHGTHVAGTVGGTNYGVAKNSHLIAVKVLDCRGSGSFSGVLKGLEFSLKYFMSSKKASVVNMSLGGPKSRSLNNAVSQLVKYGMHVVVAAGNSNQDACDTSPSSEPSVITVGATTEKATLASFSNWGSCVNILAPGTNIKSLLPGDKTGSLQGTSMSSPHVAGVAALILNRNPELPPSTLLKILSSRCTKDAILNLHKETPNCLLYSLN